MQNGSFSLNKYLFSGGVWSLFGKFITSAGNTLFLALLARVLVPDDMAVFFLAQSIAVFLALLCRFGLDNTLLRYVAEFNAKKQNEALRQVVYKGFGILVCTSLFFSFCYLIVSHFIAINLLKSDSLYQIRLLIAIWSIFLAFQFVISAVFRGIKDIKNAVIFGGMATAIATPTVYYVIVKSGVEISLPLSINILITVGIFSAIIGVFYLRHIFSNLAISENKIITSGSLVNHSWPLLINSIAFFMLSQSAIWIVGLYYSGINLAAFGAANRLVLLTSMTLVIVNSVLPPLIAQYNVLSEKKKLQELLRSTATAASLPVLAILFVILFFPAHILALVFGEEYALASPILVVLTICQVVNVYVGSCGYVLIMTGYKTVVMLITLASSFAAISLGLLVVESKGPFGVACAFSVAVILQQVLMLIMTKIKVDVWTNVGIEGFKLLLKRKLVS